jgi:hypothetical protein
MMRAMDVPVLPPPAPTQPSMPAPSLPSLPPPTRSSTIPTTSAATTQPTTWVAVSSGPTRRPRRRGRWVAAGLVVGAIVATGAVVLTRDTPAEAYSLTQAATQANDARTLSYELEMGMGEAGSATAEASLDLDDQLMSMTMSMDMIDQPIEAMFDIGENTMYMSTDAFEGLEFVIGDASWVSIDFEDLTGLDLGSLQQMTDNPLDVTEAFLAADSVEEVGFDEVNGQQVKHYRVTVDTDDVLAAMPSFEESLGDIPGFELPETYVYDVYVTEANEMVRMAYDYEVLGQTMSIDLTVTGVNQPVDIVLPDPADVVDMSDLGM